VQAGLLRLHPRLQPPVTIDPTVRLVTAIVTGLVGLLGAASTAIELLGVSAGARIFGLFFPALVPLAKLSLLVMLVVHAALLAGAYLCFTGDARGPRVVWAGAWSLAAVALASLLWFLALTPMTQGWSLLAEATRGHMQGQVMVGTLWVLVQAALIAGLVLKLDGFRGGRAATP
jgi:hypothetical protein